MEYKNLEELIAVVAKLRAPDGCPWDRAQTHATLRPNMIEEAYEAGRKTKRYAKRVGLVELIIGIILTLFGICVTIIK